MSRQAGVLEIEITPEMVEAGVDGYFSVPIDRDGPLEMREIENLVSVILRSALSGCRSTH